jgi:hypothetical protein
MEVSVTVLMMGRPRQGTVGERARSVHVFKVAKVRQPGWLVALCGSRFHRPDVEFLGVVTGMPCEICLSRNPGSGEERSADVNAVISDLHSFDCMEVLARRTAPHMATPSKGEGQA